MRKFLREWAPVIGLMLLAGVLRLYELGAWPPGLYHDEAYYGLDALRVIGGERPLYFAANNGREPFFIYLAALSIDWLGRTIYALRLPSALIGIMTIPVTYWMARELFNRRVGLLAAAFMTVTLWPIHLSLISFRAGTLPLFIALSIAAGVRAYRSGRWYDWLIAGALYGTSFYTYLAGRFTPVVLVLFGLGLIFARRFKRLWPGALIFVVAAGIVVAPLVITAVANWDVVMGRPGDVSILNPVINGGDVAGTAIGNTVKALGMFFWQGDRIPRHNVPYRPVFDWLVTIVFVFGLVRLILGAIQRRRTALPSLPDFLDYTPITRVALPNKLPGVFVLLWIAVMLLPTILAEDTPHFLRAVGILPVLMVIPAVGLDTLAQWVSARIRVGRVLSWVVIVGVLAVSTAQTIVDYTRYAADPNTAYAFESAAVTLAHSARGALAAGYRVAIDERLVRDYPSIAFLVERPFESVPDGVQPAALPRGDTTLFFRWPYAEWWRALTPLDGPHAVRVTAGPLARGDRDVQPFYAYVRVQAEPVALTLAPEARFANGAQLLGHSIERLSDTQWRLRTLWSITGTLSADQTFFVHLALAGQVMITADGDNGDGFYPMRLWRPGDVIVDERTLVIAPHLDRTQLLIELGLYDRATTQRVTVIDSAQAVVNNAILLGGPSGEIGP